MGVEIVNVKLQNNEARVWVLGDSHILPGQSQDVDRALLDVPAVQDALEQGHLSVIVAGKKDEPSDSSDAGDGAPKEETLKKGK